MSRGPEEKKDDIPLWLISFTDMVTLLLSFFVMLQAFAHQQDPELFYEGQGSFNRAIRGLGIPQWLLGKQDRMHRDFFIKRHAVDPSEHPAKPQPIIDDEEDRLKQVLQQLREKFDSSSSDVTQETMDVTASPLRFEGTSMQLRKADRAYLDDLAMSLSQSQAGRRGSVYVIGLAPDAQGRQRQYVLGAQRAEAVRGYLGSQLRRAGASCDLLCWGGGARFGSLPQGTQIGIIVMGD